MEKSTIDSNKQKTENINSVKTNQEYNKQKPDPKDPNQSKNHQIGEEEVKENQERKIKADVDPDAGIDSNRGTQAIDESSQNNPDAKTVTENSLKTPKDTNKNQETNTQTSNKSREDKADDMRGSKVSQPEDSSTGKM